MSSSSHDEERGIPLTDLTFKAEDVDNDIESPAGSEIVRVTNRTASQHTTPSATRVPIFPLQQVTTRDLQGLCAALWDWNICFHCTQDRTCRNPDGPSSCPWSRRSDRLQPFFDYYKSKTSSYVPEDFRQDGRRMAFSSHEDLFQLITWIRTWGPHHPNKDALRMDFFGDPTDEIEGGVCWADQDRATDLVVELMTMTTLLSSVDHTDHHYIESRRSVNIEKILGQIFPTRVHPSLCDDDRQAQIIKKGLEAYNLVNRAGLKLEKTDDLREHLKLDEESGVVKIFTWSSVLKESLLSSLPKPPVEDPLAPSDLGYDKPTPEPVIPRLLALETLHTLHLLFPPSSKKSQSILRNLILKSSFDSDVLRFKTSGLSAFELGPEERGKALKFGIWGSRLMDLYDEIENPKPRSELDIWLERRSKSRHVMMATIAGVAAAVLLGVLGLVVGVLQLWISWEQWNWEKEKARKGE